MYTIIHLMRGQMSKPLDELGGKCPYMPFLDRGQMSEGEHVRPPFMCILKCLWDSLFPPHILKQSVGTNTPRKKHPTSILVYVDKNHHMFF